MLYLWKQFKKHNLTMSFSLIVALFLLFGLFTFREILILGNLTRTIYEHPLVVSNASTLAALNIAKMHRDMKDVVLADSPEEMEASLALVTKGEETVFTSLDSIKDKIIGAQGLKLEQETRKLFLDWRPIRKQVIDLVNSGDTDSAAQITQGIGAAHVEKLERKMLELTSYARRKAENFILHAETTQTRLENTTINLTIAGVLASVIIAFITTAIVTRASDNLKKESAKLKQAFDEIKVLRGIIPICSYCKQIRDDAGMWKRIEEYIHTHSEASFSHGICPNCMREHFPEECAELYPDQA